MDKYLKDNINDEGISIPKYFRDLWKEKQTINNSPPANKEPSSKEELADESVFSDNHEGKYLKPPPWLGSRDNWGANSLYDTKATDTYREELIKETAQFIEEITFNEFALEISKEIIGQNNLELVLAGVFSYITGIAKTGKPPKINMLLTAPSGTGKTETFRALKNYFKEKIPSLVISQVDITHITAEGFKGKDTSAIILDLIEKHTGGYGIIFMDEFDKRISPQISAGGGDVGQEVQNQILTLLEGSVGIYTSKEINKTASIDSNLTMFIGCGTFNAVREKKKKNASKTLGFINQEASYDIYDDITREDIIDAGCSYEMLGRFPLIINYNKLEVRAIVNIIEKLKYNIILNLGFLDIIIDDTYMQDMINMANGEFGCRMLYASMFQSSMNAYTEILKRGISNPVIVKLGSSSFEIYEDSQGSNEFEYEG